MVRKKSFKLFIVFFIMWSISSCIGANGINISPEKIGSTGPILIEKTWLPFIIDENISVQITPFVEFKIDITDKELIVFPLKALRIGEEYVVKVTRDNSSYLHETIVQQPCLVYLGNITKEQEIWRFCGKEKILLTQTGGRVVDYAASGSGNWIVYTVSNEKGGTDIWKMDKEGKNNTKVNVCGEFVCNSLAIDPLGFYIAFYSNRNKGELVLFSIHEKKEILIEKGNISHIDFSPNGQYLRYFSNTKRCLRIREIGNMNLIQTIESDSDLISSWSYDSSSFLFGKRNFGGGIPGIEIYETIVSTDKSTKLFDGQDSPLEYFHPTYFENENLVILVRIGFSGNSKQIWVIDKEGEKIFEVTNDQQYDHSGLSWNYAEERLSFQRYLLTNSNSLPEVWIWESKANQFQLVAKNAAHATWIP